MGSLRVFIASPDERLRLALFVFLDDEPNVVVVGMSDRPTGLVSQLRGAVADVLLLDWEVPVQGMVDFLGDLESLEHRPKTIVLSSKVKEKDTILAAGADHFIAKDSPPDTLIPILNDIRGVNYAM